MRILVVTHVWEPENGVPQRRWAWLTDALIARGHEIQVIAPPPHYPGGKLLSQLPQHQAKSHGHGDRGEYIWRARFRPHGKTLISRIVDQAVTMASTIIIGRRVCKKFQPDLIIATAPPLPAIFSAQVLSALGKAPYLIDLRDSWPDLLDYLLSSRDHRGRVEGSPFKRAVLGTLSTLTRKRLTHALKGAAGVVTTSESFARLLTQRGVRSTLPVFNIADLPDHILEPPAAKSGALNVVYAGTTGRAQELASALRAISRAQSRGITVNLRVIGGGAHIETLKHNAKSLNLDVEFLGRIPRREMVTHYRWADTVLVQLQSWSALDTTIPSKIFEAMAYGRHITASVNGETAAIIKEAHCGDVAPAQDEYALADLLVSIQNDRSKLMVGNSGRQWLEKFASKQALEQSFVEFVENQAVPARASR